MNTKVELLIDVYNLIQVPYDKRVIVEAHSKGHQLRIEDIPCPKNLSNNETALDYPCLIKKFVKENNITLGGKIKITLEKVDNLKLEDSIMEGFGKCPDCVWFNDEGGCCSVPRDSDGCLRNKRPLGSLPLL